MRGEENAPFERFAHSLWDVPRELDILSQAIRIKRITRWALVDAHLLIIIEVQIYWLDLGLITKPPKPYLR